MTIEPEERDESDQTDPFDHPLFQYPEASVRMQSVTHALIVLLGALVVANVFLFVGLDVLGAAGHTEETSPVVFFTVQLSLNFVAFLVVSIVFLHWHDTPLIGLRRPTVWGGGVIVAGFVLFVGVMAFQEFLLSLLELETAENVAIQLGRENPELFLVLLPIQVVLTAPAEELLFRGVIQGLFRRAYGILPAVVFTSVLFALFHVPALAGSAGLAPVLVVLFVSSVVLGLLYEYTQNLVVPIAIHALWNMLVFGMLYLQAVGTF